MNGRPVPGHNEVHMNRSLGSVLLAAVLAGACAARGGGGDDDDDDSAGVEECSTGYDEDGDLLVDCFDPDCMPEPECQRTENCSNLVDDDGDTLIDCADPGCAADAACAPDPETQCADELDDDDDGATDCDDTDCAASPACAPAPGGDCAEVCAREEECGRANPGCVDACECSNEQVLAPAFSESFYACIVDAACSIFDDSTPCFDQADFSSSPTADQLVELCQDREDCAGIPCEYFGMFNDDALEDLRTCMTRGDCLTCLEDASSVCPAL